MLARRIFPAGLAVISALACSSSLRTSQSPEPVRRSRPEPVRTSPAPRAVNRQSTAARLGIPPGHLPPAGECRIWLPGTPPGRQRAAESCRGIERHAPAGSWIVYRPSRDRTLVHIRVVDNQRAGSVILVRVYDVADGSFVREENP